MPLKPRTAVVQPLDESIKLIALTKNQLAIVDAADYERINAFAWQAKWDRNTKQFRAERSIRLESGKRRTLGMHREIMGDPDGFQIDHRNHNTLDNRRENLRQCTSAENSQHRKRRVDNVLGMKGVWTQHGTFKATITKNGVKRYLGSFPSAEEASAAYIEASKLTHGEFSIFRDK